MNRIIGRRVLTLLAVGLFQFPQQAVAQSEGIKVHGHWTIDIREPGGKLVTHREFTNALTLEAQPILAYILTRAAVPGLWRIGLMGEGPSALHDSPCLAGGLPAQSCYISEPNDSENSHENLSPTLTVSVPTALGPDRYKMVLEGTTRAARAADIVRVFTTLGRCQMGAPQPCNIAESANHFTSTRISNPATGVATPILVAAGQIIQVKVVISFQ